MYTLRSLLLFMPSYGSVFATSSVYQGSAMIVVIVSYPPRLCITVFWDGYLFTFHRNMAPRQFRNLNLKEEVTPMISSDPSKLEN